MLNLTRKKLFTISSSLANKSVDNSKILPTQFTTTLPFTNLTTKLIINNNFFKTGELPMKYIKVRFGKDLGHMHSRLQRTIDEMFQQVNPMLALPEHTWRPQIDMYETAEGITVLINVPGVERQDLEVEVDQKALRVKGVRREMARVPGMKYHLAEIDYGRFERVLFLPRPINPEQVQASYTNGLLRIVIGKTPPPKARRIPIEND